MSWRRLGGLLALVWLASLAVAYWFVHIPLGADSARALFNLMLDVTAVGALLALAGSAGQLIVGNLTHLPALGRATLAALLGLLAESTVILLLGLVGGWPPRWLAWLATLLLIAVLHRPLLAWIRDLRSGLYSVLAPADDDFLRWVRRAVLTLLGLSLVLALLPPTTWDALVYHLTGPELYLQAGRIIPFPENHHLGFPQLVEMLYLWLMLLARPHAAGLLHAVFGVLTLAGLQAVAGEERQEAGWVAAGALLVSDSLWGLFSWSYNDLALLAYVTGALVALLAWHSAEVKQRPRLLVVTGLLTGGMMVVKYTAAVYTLGIALLIVWMTWNNGLWRTLRVLAWVAGMALLAFGPTLLKNTVIDGNPLSPFVWGTAAYDQLDAWYYLRAGTGVGLTGLPLLPLQATVFGVEGGAYQASSGPLVLGLLPLALVGWRERSVEAKRLISALALFALPSVIGWLIGSAVSWFLMQNRLLFPAFPALSLIGALGLAGMRRSDRWEGLARIGQVVVLASLLLAILSAGLATVRINPLPVLAGAETEDEFLLRELQAHYIAMQRINDLPDDARVLFLWEPRAYYCERQCLPDTLISRWWHDRQVYGTLPGIVEQWQQMGMTHVLIFEAGGRFLIEQEPYDPMTEADWHALDELRVGFLTPLWDDLDSYTLYRLEGE